MNSLTKSHMEVQNCQDKVPKPQSPIFPHISQNKCGENIDADLVAKLQDGIPEALGPQDPRLLLGVVLEGRLPVLQTAHQVFEVHKLQSTTSCTLY